MTHREVAYLRNLRGSTDDPARTLCDLSQYESYMFLERVLFFPD